MNTNRRFLNARWQQTYQGNVHFLRSSEHAHITENNGFYPVSLRHQASWKSPIDILNQNKHYLVCFLCVLRLMSDQDDGTFAFSHQESLDAFLEEVSSNVHVKGWEGIILRRNGGKENLVIIQARKSEVKERSPNSNPLMPLLKSRLPMACLEL